MHRQYVLASDNAGKLREMADMFGPLGFSVRPQGELGVPPDVAETGSTFIENALIKARHAALHTGLPCIADDSGLVVPSLGGEPGIYSARYAGEHGNSQANIDRLLEALTDSTGDDRQAYFYCVMVCLESASDPAPLMATGAWSGHILTSPRGDGGFGYDPVFGVTAKAEPGLHKSAAEMTAGEKARVSHRGQALRRLATLIRKGSEGPIQSAD